MPPKQAHTRLITTCSTNTVWHLFSWLPPTTSTWGPHQQKTDHLMMEWERERERDTLLTCTHAQMTNQCWAICSAALNQMGRWQTELSFSYRSLPLSLSLSHPPNSFCFFPSPWLLTPFYDSLLSSLAFLWVISPESITSEPVWGFCIPLSDLFWHFANCSFSCQYFYIQYILPMKVLLLATGIVHPNLAIQLLTLQVDTNIHNFCLRNTKEQNRIE